MLCSPPSMVLPNLFLLSWTRASKNHTKLILITIKSSQMHRFICDRLTYMINYFIISMSLLFYLYVSFIYPLTQYEFRWTKLVPVRVSFSTSFVSDRSNSNYSTSFQHEGGILQLWLDCVWYLIATIICDTRSEWYCSVIMINGSC